MCSNEIITNQVYLGVSPICTIAKAGNPILLEMKIPSDRITQVKSDWNWQASLDTYSGQIDTRVNHVDCQRIQVTLPSEVNIQDIASVRVTCESMYYPTLIPTAALHTNKVYVIESSFGDWGQPVYTVRSILVEPGESDQEYTGILGSFSREHHIIISSSDPLVEGQIVIPDHLE